MIVTVSIKGLSTSRNFVNGIWKCRNIFQKCGSLNRSLKINWMECGNLTAKISLQMMV